MKIVFERDEIVSIEHFNIDICDYNFAGPILEVQVLLSEHKNIFQKLKNVIFDVELRFSEDTLISGSFLWSHNANGYCFFRSTGSTNYTSTEKPENTKAFKRIRKIENQLKKLKKDLND